MLGCGARLDTRGHFTPDDVRQWQRVECSDELQASVYSDMYDGVATPGAVMYYYRCKSSGRSNE